MLSLRFALQHWPRSARFFVLALALLQLVAPTWHICELGGHVMARGASSNHHGANQAEKPSDPRQALICYCAPHETAIDPNAPRLDGTTHQDHATCLALLLQTMPGEIGAPPSTVQIRRLRDATFTIRRETSPQIALLRRFRGRAPPMSV